MTIFTCQIEKDVACVLTDTAASPIDHSRKFSATKCHAIPHLGALVTGRGIGSILHWVFDRIANEGFQSFDEVLDQAGEIVEEVYEDFFEYTANRFGFYEKAEAQGYDTSSSSFFDLLKDYAGENNFNVQADVVLIGYSAIRNLETYKTVKKRTSLYQKIMPITICSVC
ncbi:MAG: hypothetical protein K9J81_09540 [Desulfohalobiaceae bacterium]|nr:hypothetical protein [Desulfohalobiaceae bacterium]